MSRKTPFRISVPEPKLQRIRERVAEYEWHEQPDDADWQYGTNLDYMKELQAHWLERFDWRTAEAGLNRFPQFLVDVDGVGIHVIHEKGSGPAPRPLMLVHGWPGSTFEFMNLIERLAHPERFGGDVSMAFDVIVPSLPGYGFSGKPKRPIGPRIAADILDRMMVEGLGYDRYFAQGGDWGSAVLGWLGLDHPDHCRAIHLNMITLTAAGEAPGFLGSKVAPPETPEELAWAASLQSAVENEFGYVAIQSTKPQTLSYAMMDSPIGTAAWIVEKFHGWSDLRGQPLDAVFSKDALLTNIMIYLVTGTFNTASWMYRGAVADGIALPRGRRLEIPVAVAVVPHDIIRTAPRSHVEKAYNVVHWTVLPAGGHFAALEVPELLLSDVQAFFSGVSL